MICFHIVPGAGHMDEEMFHASRDNTPPSGARFVP
jgi:hypothetical protein